MVLSVVIPVYNKANRIAGTLHSVLKQTFSDFEVIVVDDGSSDGSAEVVQSFADTDPRIVLVRQANQGVSKARNTGVEQAKSDIVAFIDADDEWKRDFLDAIASLVRSYPEAGMYALSYYSRNTAENRITPHTNHLPEGWEGIVRDYDEYYLGGMAIHSSSLAIRKTAFDSVGGFKVGAIMSEDLLFVMQVLRKNKLAYKNSCGAYYNEGVEESATSLLGVRRGAFDYAKDSLLNGIADILKNEPGLPPLSRTVLQRRYDSKLRHIFQYNMRYGNGIDRRYLANFMTAKGRLYGIPLLLLSFLPRKALVRLYEVAKRLKHRKPMN